MINRLPTHLPPFDLVLSDLANPSPAALAKAMGVSARTAAGWIKAAAAPRPVELALFWLTRWGVSAVDADAHNAATMHAAHAAALACELARAEARIAHLVSIGDYGAANDPSAVVASAAARLRLAPLPRDPVAHGRELANDDSGHHGPGQHSKRLGQHLA